MARMIPPTLMKRIARDSISQTQLGGEQKQHKGNASDVKTIERRPQCGDPCHIVTKRRVRW